MAQRRVKVIQKVWGDPTNVGSNRLWQSGEELSTEIGDLPGHIYTYLDDQDPTDSAPDPEPLRAMAHLQLAEVRVRDALEKLDHDDDSHWTARGLPRIEILNLLIEGDIGANHNDIRAAWPGFCREPSLE
jgi:hypothetical protein